MSNTIECAEHGEQQETFTCEHLLRGVGLGFNTVPEADPDNARPDAWCDSCELLRQDHGGWNEESERQIKVVLLCGKCYDEARSRNTR